MRRQPRRRVPLLTAMIYKLLQININHARAAQDLLLHSLTDRKCSLAIVAEPYRIPDCHPNWISDNTGTIAITWRWWDGAPISSILEKGTHYVAVRWGQFTVIGLYFPPSGSIANYERWLEDVASCVRRYATSPTIVGGDFNAWSVTWRSRYTNQRGTLVEDWASSLGLGLLNKGTKSTCVRPQGSSIVDLTWASLSAERLLVDWRVLDTEHLSDHKCIAMDFGRISLPGNPPSRMGSKRDEHPRWAIRQLDVDKLLAIVTINMWHRPVIDRDPNVEEAWIRDTITTACDAAMPRAKRNPRPAAYWWTAEIAQLRRDATRLSRKIRKRCRSTQEREARLEAYRDAKQFLRNSIRQAKRAAWEELLLTLNEDPWGKPYKLVLNKLRPWAPPTTEVLDPLFTQLVVGTLFPSHRTTTRIPVMGPMGLEAPLSDWHEGLAVTIDELTSAIKRSFRGRNTAPGPDGLQKKVLALISGELNGPLQNLINGCLRTGVIPDKWKRANLALILKEGKDNSQPSAYRPICLINELGKLCERVIVTRVTKHLSSMGPNIAQHQFGFRCGRSTIDAISRVRSLTDDQTSQGRVVLAISLDIKNAFNSLPWDKIKQALRSHNVPPYLCRVIDNYLSDRFVSYKDRTGITQHHRLSCGVPQGSVLGPLLWNIGYNTVLQAALPPSCHILCYADDTLLLAGGENWQEAIHRGELASSSVMRTIRQAGLEVSVDKTEAIFFHAKNSGMPPSGLHIRLGETQIPIKRRLKYLGVILDGLWSFEGHFDAVGVKTKVRANTMCRILPNLGGPDNRVRRLYMGTVRSIALYGAPLWAEALVKSRRGKTIMLSALHPMILRVARTYRTVSRSAAQILAGIPPITLLAEEQRKMYQALCLRKRRGIGTSEKIRLRMRHHFRQKTMDSWQRELATEMARAGGRVLLALQPVLDEWTNRTHGFMTYRMAQIITGHGCFGTFLHRIGKEETPRCHHCEATLDTAQHTLAVCPAWTDEREELWAFVGEDLSLPATIKAILQSEEKWRSFSLFCEIVLEQKEQAERERQGVPLPRHGRPVHSR